MVRVTTGNLMGYCAIVRFACKLDVHHHDYYRSCHEFEETESVQHLVCECPALQSRFHRFLDNRTFEDLMIVVTVTLRKVASFIQS